jgi:hypothetical protein
MKMRCVAPTRPRAIRSPVRRARRPDAGSALKPVWRERPID